MSITPDEMLKQVAVEVAKENASKVYDDAVKEPLSETSKLVTRIPRAINAALSSIDIWITKKEYNVEATKILLQEKLKFINPDKIVSPEAYVAVPAIQAISYSMDSNELRDMFANLLASSINLDIKNAVHPSFVEIIKQLSPDEARILRHFKSQGLNEISKCKLRYQKKSNNSQNNSNIFSNTMQEGYDIIKTLILYKDDPYKVEPCLNNLERLGLIKIDDSYVLAKDDYYIDFSNISLVKHLRELSLSNPKDFPYIFPSEDEYECELILLRGTIFITSLGSQFINICVS